MSHFHCERKIMKDAMRVVLFGASGMVGQGALRECLRDPDVAMVLSVVRKASGVQHAKLRELVHADLTDLAPIADQLEGYDACFFCVGVSSARMEEGAYTRITYDTAAEAARVLAQRNPGMTFVFVSAAGADSSEQGRVMWARVKGRAENFVFRQPFAAAYALRPAMIEPLHGAVSKTTAYRVFYKLARPVLPLLRRLAPGQVSSTEQIGRVMLRLVREGGPKRVLESADIVALGRE
jgi:uncharacterized protein YbjT (DUF2867 family)